MAQLGGLNPNLLKNVAGSALDSVLEAVNPFEKVMQREMRDFKKGFGLGFKTDAWSVTIAFENKDDKNTLDLLRNSLAYGLKDNIAKSFGNIGNKPSNILSTIQSSLQGFTAGFGPFALGSKLSKPMAGPTWKGFCSSIRIPGSTLGTQNPYGQVKIPINKGRENLGMTFYNDQFNVNHQFFRNYIDFIAPAFDNVRYFDDYSCTIYIDLLTTQQNRYTSYVYYGCAPVSMNEINLTGEGARDAQSVAIEFVWEHCRISSTLTKAPSGFLGSALDVVDFLAPNLEADELIGAAAILGTYILKSPGLLSPQLADTIKNSALSQGISNILNGNPLAQQNLSLDPDLLRAYLEPAKNPKETVQPGPNTLSTIANKNQENLKEFRDQFN